MTATDEILARHAAAMARTRLDVLIDDAATVGCWALLFLVGIAVLLALRPVHGPDVTLAPGGKVGLRAAVMEICHAR